MEHIIIIGAGQAGAQAAQSLRGAGFSGQISIFGAEPVLPYHRPPLSKKFLIGEAGEDTLAIRTEEFYRSQKIAVRVNCAVEEIDAKTACVKLAGEGKSIAYDRLIIATGGRAKVLPVGEGGVEGGDKENIYTLRTLADARLLKPVLRGGKTLAIIGGGYIGLEVAAAARQKGVKTILLESEPRLLARTAAPLVAEFFARLHREHGAEIHCQQNVEKISGGKQADGLLSGGKPIAADMILAAVGMSADTALAQSAGLECSKDGRIITDEHSRTSARHIWAAGDCASTFLPLYQCRAGLESVQNAIDQARLAAADITGAPAAHLPLVPWFWSDQYDCSLRTAGWREGHDEQLVRGEAESGSFCVFYLRRGVLIAADAINRPAEFMAARRLIAASARIPSSQLADDSQPPKLWLRQIQ